MVRLLKIPAHFRICFHPDPVRDLVMGLLQILRVQHKAVAHIIFLLHAHLQIVPVFADKSLHGRIPLCAGLCLPQGQERILAVHVTHQPVGRDVCQYLQDIPFHLVTHLPEQQFLPILQIQPAVFPEGAQNSKIRIQMP